MNVDTFLPSQNNGSVNLTVTTTAQSIQVPCPAGAYTSYPSRSYRVRVVGTSNVYIEISNSADVAATLLNSMCLLPDSVEIFNGPENAYFSCISSGPGSSVNITPGKGT